MTPPTACPAWPGIGEKTAASLLLNRSATSTGSSRPPRTRSPTWPRAPRRKINDAADYLAVAPKVVAVARDIDLAPYDATLPSDPRRPGPAGRAGERYSLECPRPRCVAALAG